jgi:hypothetical protein
MRKTVKDLVTKEWASSAREILTGSAPDITSLFTRLCTMNLEHVQKLKTIAARDRFQLALVKLNDAIKYGWAHGFNGSQTRFTRPDNHPPNRRVGALLPLAVAAGKAVGEAQAAKINRAHKNADAKGLGLQHTHASTAA